MFIDCKIFLNGKPENYDEELYKTIKSYKETSKLLYRMSTDSAKPLIAQGIEEEDYKMSAFFKSMIDNRQ